MIYFTADLHMGHTNIILHCDRPFASAEEMDAALISNWNATVNSHDEVYILGDFTMKPAAEAQRYLSALYGRKYMIRGNHDKFLNNHTSVDAAFEWIKDYFVLKYEGRRFVLFHYPICEWDYFYRGAIHLYGHIHNAPASTERANGLGRAINVGVDVNGFRPISIDEIISMAERL